MAGLISVQSGAAALDNVGPVVASTPDQWSGDAFTALLSGALQTRSGPDARSPAVAKPSNSSPDPAADIAKKPVKQIRAKPGHVSTTIAALHGSTSAFPLRKAPLGAASGIPAAMGQEVPGDTLAAPDVASQARMATISLPPRS